MKQIKKMIIKLLFNIKNYDYSINKLCANIIKSLPNN